MIIRPMTPNDILGAVELQRACFPPPFPEELLWRAEHLARHLELFPEGQFVAVDTDNAIWGSASSVLISEENYNAHRNWDTTVGGPFLNAHDPHGTTLYGVDISVRKPVGKASPGASPTPASPWCANSDSADSPPPAEFPTSARGARNPATSPGTSSDTSTTWSGTGPTTARSRRCSISG